MMDGELLNLVQNLGLPLLIAVVFIADGRAREKRMAERLDAVQDGHTDRLSGVIERNTEAFARFAEAVRNCPAKEAKK